MAPEPPTATRLLDVRSEHLDLAASILDNGGLVGIPTETVYGLAADAENDTAVGRIFDAKGRPADHPLIVHVLPQWATLYATEWDGAAARLADAFWPGPLTIVVPSSGRASRIVTGGLDSVGLRSPDHPVALGILERLGRAVAAPSANRYGHVSPTSASHVLDDLDGRIDAVVDAGSAPVGLESTIVHVDSEGLTLLRKGAVGVAQLSDAAGIRIVDGTSGPVRAPGMVLSHYAPAAPVSVRDRVPDHTLDDSVLVISAVPVAHPRAVVMEDAISFAAGLYDALRLGDDPAVSRVIVIPPTDGDLLPAILDRLTRASH